MSKKETGKTRIFKTVLKLVWQKIWTKRNLLFLIVFTAATAFLIYGLHHFAYEGRILTLVMTYIVTFLVASILRAILLTYIPAESLMLVHGHITHIFENGTWLWRKQYKEYLFGKNGELASYRYEAHKIGVEINGDPPILCIVGITRYANKDAFMAMRKLIDSYFEQLGYSKSYNDLIKFLAYEFVKEKRVELGRLDNPADWTQQKKYTQLLWEFLEGKTGSREILGVNLYSGFELLSKSEPSGRSKLYW
jgi:hypothetical protein